MKKEAKTFTLIILSLFGLYGCIGTKDKYPTNASMSVPYQVTPTLTINVLSYKLISSKTDLPQMSAPPANGKYIAFRLILSNPGKNRGVKSSFLPQSIEKIQVFHPKFKRPAEPSIDNMMESLEKYNLEERGFAYAPIAPGTSRTLWTVALIPKDANPPYKVVFIPKDNAGPSRYMAVDVK